MDKMKKIYKQIPEWCLPVLILLLGAVLRFVYLGVVPGGLHQDEAFVALNSFGLFHEGMDSAGYRFPVYTSSWGDGQSALYSYMLVPLLLLNGGIPTAFLTRVPQAVVGTLTLWCVYCLMKRMFGRGPGLWALFLLAICPWHVMMSRWALDANLAPGFLMFALYFFIRGLENKKFLPVAAVFYGLCLYCYAIVWLIVPVMLLFQIGYGIAHKKITWNRWSVLSVVILFLIALPLMLFVVVNSGALPQINLPFMTIPKTLGYRGGEVALNMQEILANMKRAAQLFVFQNTGSPYDVLMPWGLFYDIGRVFIVLGALILVCKVIRLIFKKEFGYDYFVFVQFLGGGITCMFVAVAMHQINAIYIPLVLCEVYGIWTTFQFLKKRKEVLGQMFTGVIVTVYLVCLVLFQRDYYTEYRTLTDAYFAKGVEGCVDYALEKCEETGLSVITVEKGAQWPRLLLFTETLPSEYLSSVEYDVAPAPGSFVKDGIRINTRINYDNINQESIYIIYYNDLDTFEEDFELTVFEDYWYVAVPKQ